MPSQKKASSSPQWKQCRLGSRPQNDDVYFEQMTKVVFRSGLSWPMIDNKWPDFKKAFASFSVQKVARFNEAKFDQLLKNQAIIRNGRKITATLDNAKTILALRKEHGSFSNYLKEIKREGEDKLCKTLAKRFSFLGGSTTVFFLRAVGEKMPETLKRWEEEGW